MKSVAVITMLAILPLLVSSIPFTEDNPQHINEQLLRTRVKRSGSPDFLGSVKRGFISGLGKASANVAGGSSGSSASSSFGSSSSGSSGKHYGPSHHEETKLDGWQLKKSIFNTIFQAVKAIAGGVTAIKGQLIKGSGYLVSGSGKLIAASGDKVTSVGKKIALSAHLVKPSPHHFAKFSGASSSSHGHNEHSGPTGHSESFTSFESPAGGHTSYGIPAAPHPSTSYGAPVVHHTHYSTHTDHSYLPPSSSHSTSYSGPPSHSYGVASLEGPSSSYGSPHHEEYKNTHGHDNFAHTSYDEDGTSIHTSKTTAKSLKSAADVLRQLLHKLPTPTTHTTDDDESSDSVGGYPYAVHSDSGDDSSSDHKIQQFEIPLDPVPAFKPLKMSSYLQDLSEYGPVNSVSHTQTITTAFGAPISDYQKPVPLVTAPIVHHNQPQPQFFQGYGPPPPQQQHSTALQYNGVGNYQNNNAHKFLISPSLDVTKSQQWSSANVSPVQQYPIPPSPNSYSVYETMAFKRAAANPQAGGQQSHHNQPQLPQPTRTTLQSIEDMDKHVHQQQLNQIQNTFGGEFEIQKSIGYEFNNVNTNKAQIKKRIDETIAD